MVTVQLSDSTAAALAAQAMAVGLSIDAYLERQFAVSAALRQRIHGEEFERLLDAEVTAGPAYQGTYTRAEIYLDHN